MRLGPLLVCGVIAGCGGLTYEEFDEEWRDARCSYDVRCGVYASMADCRAATARFDYDNPVPRAALDAGKLVFDEDAAQRCLDAYAALSCDRTEQRSADLAACGDVLRGTVKNGEACAFSDECTSGVCSIAPGCDQACCPGSCSPPRSLPTTGEACTSLCDETAYCGSDNICHALLPEGAACDSTSLCGYTLYCAGLGTSGSGVCTPLPGNGEPCEFLCAQWGAVCHAGLCVPAGLPGDPCEVDSQCSSNWYRCDQTAGACAVYPALGEACTSTCSGAAWCSDGQCVARQQDGAACTNGDQCESMFCNRGTCGDVPLCI